MLAKGSRTLEQGTVMKEVLFIGGSSDGKRREVSDKVRLIIIPRESECSEVMWTDGTYSLPDVKIEYQRYFRSRIADSLYVFMIEGMSHTELMNRLLQHYKPTEAKSDGRR